MRLPKLDRRRALAVTAILAALYLAIAYFAAPGFWGHYERHHEIAGLGARTVTAQGIPGDVINVGLEGSEADLMCAMTAAGWSPSDPVTMMSSLKIAGSVAFRRPYHRGRSDPLWPQRRRRPLPYRRRDRFRRSRAELREAGGAGGGEGAAAADLRQERDVRVAGDGAARILAARRRGRPLAGP